MLPDEMKNDCVIGRIEMVPVIVPAAGTQVDLDAAGAKLASDKEDERVTKIRSETVTPGTAVNDLQGNAISGIKSRRYRSRMPGSAKRDLGYPRRFPHSCLTADGFRGAARGRR